MYTLKCLKCKFETKPMVENDLYKYANLKLEYKKEKTKINKNKWIYNNEYFCPDCGDSLCLSEKFLRLVK
jgi:acetone carboxylase gamma subunit